MIKTEIKRPKATINIDCLTQRLFDVESDVPLHLLNVLPPKRLDFQSNVDELKGCGTLLKHNNLVVVHQENILLRHLLRKSLVDDMSTRISNLKLKLQLTRHEAIALQLSSI